MKNVKHRLIHVEHWLPQNQAMLQGPAFGEFLRKRAHSLRVAQARLAKAAGVQPQAVTGWFNTGKISRESLRAIAPLLQSSVDALLAGSSAVPQQAELPLTDDQSQLLKVWGMLAPKQRAEELAKLEELAAANVDLLRELGHISPGIDRAVPNETVAKHLGAVPTKSAAVKEVKR